MTRWGSLNLADLDASTVAEPGHYPALARPVNGFAEYLRTHPGGQILSALVRGNVEAYRQVIAAGISPNFFPYDLAYPLAVVLLADKPFTERVTSADLSAEERIGQIIDQLDRYDLYAGEMPGDEYLVDAGEDGVVWAMYSLDCLHFIARQWDGDTDGLPMLIAELKRLHAADIAVDLHNLLTDRDEESPGQWVPYSDIRFVLSALSWSDAQIVAEMKTKLANNILIKRQEGKVSFWRLAEESSLEASEKAMTQ